VVTNALLLKRWRPPVPRDSPTPRAAGDPALSTIARAAAPRIHPPEKVR
jgi:hypothetical protein